MSLKSGDDGDKNSSDNDGDDKIAEETTFDEVDEEKLAGKDEAYQIYSALSFAVILFVIGMPLWWKATEVYRVPLPYSRIGALDALELKFVTRIRIATLDPARGEKLVNDMQDIFKTSKLFAANFSTAVFPKRVMASIKNIDDLVAVSFNLKAPGTLLLLEVPGLARFSASQILLGQERIVYFSSTTTAVKLSDVLLQWLLQEDSLQRTKDAMNSPKLIDRDLAGRRRLPAAKQYDIMVTVVNPEPETIDIHLDLKTSVKEYISPLLSELSLLADFTVKSQWLYFVTLEVEPKVVPESAGMGRHFALAEDMLPHIITPLEKKLSSHVSRNPCVNFVVYVPPCSRSPLHIYRRQGMRLKTSGSLDAFLSPRWGGIAVFNPPVSVCQNESIAEPKLVIADPAIIMGTFLAQLRLLLGIPELQEMKSSAEVMPPAAEILPLTSSSVRQWEFDSLLRIRTLEQLTSATLTLQSLAQLLGEISNIVINDAVGDSIYLAVSSVEQAVDLLKAGKLDAAFNVSKTAFLSAEEAFTDPSLLALLYFPDDQKYAVYIPLFLPVMIPVLLSLKQIRTWLVECIKTKKIKVD